MTQQVTTFSIFNWFCLFVCDTSLSFLPGKIPETDRSGWILNIQVFDEANPTTYADPNISLAWNVPFACSTSTNFFLSNCLMKANGTVIFVIPITLSFVFNLSGLLNRARWYGMYISILHHFKAFKNKLSYWNHLVYLMFNSWKKSVCLRLKWKQQILILVLRGITYFRVTQLLSLR